VGTTNPEAEGRGHSERRGPEGGGHGSTVLVRAITARIGPGCLVVQFPLPGARHVAVRP